MTISGKAEAKRLTVLDHGRTIRTWPLIGEAGTARVPMDKHGAAAGRRSAATAMASPIAHLFAAQRAVLAIGAATLAALLGYVDLTRVGPTLIARATGWLGLSVPAIDRSTSDVTRSRREETRREPAHATGGTAVVALLPRPSREP